MKKTIKDVFVIAGHKIDFSAVGYSLKGLPRKLSSLPILPPKFICCTKKYEIFLSMLYNNAKTMQLSRKAARPFVNYFRTESQ